MLEKIKELARGCEFFEYHESEGIPFGSCKHPSKGKKGGLCVPFMIREKECPSSPEMGKTTPPSPDVSLIVQIRMKKLKPREVEVLSLVAIGLRRNEIAGKLFLSESTVKRSLANIQEKLGTRSTAHSVAIAMRGV